MYRFLWSGPGGATRAVDFGLLLLRVAVGVGLASHGVKKLPPPSLFVKTVAGLGFPLAVVFAWLAALSEFCGGILLALGLLARPSALFLLITMSVALFGAHRHDGFSQRELSMLYGSAAALFLLAGPGRFSLGAVVLRGGGRRGAGRPLRRQPPKG